MGDTVRMVGRGDERSRVVAALDGAVRDGEGRLVVVTGSSGSGKTLFARTMEPVAAERSIPYAYGACPSGDMLSPFGGLEDVVQLLGRDEQVGRLADSLLRAKGLPLLGSDSLQPSTRSWKGSTLFEQVTLDGPRRRRLALFDGVSRILDAASGGRPLMAVIDDMQRADEVLVDYLEYLVHDLPMIPLVLLLLWDSSVDDENGRDGLVNLARGSGLQVSEVTLDPLGADDMAEILAMRYAGHHFSDDFVRVLFTESGGNPRLLSELCTTLELLRIIHRGGSDWYNGAWADLAPGEGLEGAVYRRLTKLTEDDVELLEFLAGLPPRFPLALLGTPEVADYVGVHERALLKRLCKLVDPFRIFSFDGRDVVQRQCFLHDAIASDVPHHVIARDSDILARGLERLHGTEPSAASGTIARSFDRAGEEHRALHHYLQAVGYLDSYGASNSATRHLLQTLACLRHRVQDEVTMQSIVDVQISLAEHYQLQGSHAEAVDCLERTLPLLSTVEGKSQRGVIELRIAVNIMEQGNIEDGEAILADRVGNEDAQVEERVVAALLLGRYLSYRGHVDRAMEALKEGAALADGQGETTSPYAAALLVATGALWMERSDPAKARSVFERALVVAPLETPERVDVLCWLALVDFKQGMSDEASQRIMEALSLAERLSYLAGRARATEVMASLEEAGNPSETVRLLHRAYGFLIKSGDRVGIQRVAGRLGVLYRGIDDVERASFFLGESYQILERMGRREAQIQTGLMLGELVLKANKLYEAENLFGAVARIAGEVGNRTAEGFAYFGLGKVYLAQRKAERAREKLEQARSVFSDLKLAERVEMVEKELRLLTL